MTVVVDGVVSMGIFETGPLSPLPAQISEAWADLVQGKRRRRRVCSFIGPPVFIPTSLDPLAAIARVPALVDGALGTCLTCRQAAS